ncbi:hypothetical protein CAP35_08110 [Chitinophagaceae bacterium IBVUCB1]|nr:hypothetical protein CAP35_08110 [Chitinophagaceae bacterium IBVUCB1]
MKKILYAAKATLLVAMITLPLSSFAHTTWCNTKYGWGCNCGGGGYAVPLEGAAALLIAGAAGLGIKKYRGNKKNK